jgi:hypothetical protein
VALKCGDNHIKQINDSTYQILPRNPQEEIKVKLYYKNLPVDVYTLPIIARPKVGVALENGQMSLKLEELKSAKLNFMVSDPTIAADGFVFYNCKATIISESNQAQQFLILYDNKLDKLERLAKINNSKCKLVISDVNLKNGQNQVLNFEANPFEVDIIK